MDKLIETIYELAELGGYEEMVENHKTELVIFKKQFPDANDEDFIRKRNGMIKSYFDVKPWTKRQYLDEAKVYSVLRYNDFLKDQLIEIEDKPLELPEKLKLLVTPSQFGHFISELIKGGYIEAPLRKGMVNYSQLAKICFSMFEIRSKLGDLTTKENLENELNPIRNTLAKIEILNTKIPRLSDLSKK